jgi:hypothetical protein
MKKIIVCCLLLCCCALLKAQTKQDSLPQKAKQPMFMPNIGFSTLLGGYAKVGTWIKLTNRFYGEVGYAYYHYVNDRLPNEYYESTYRHKFLLGVNFLNKRSSFFQNFSVRKGFYKEYSRVTYRTKNTVVTNQTINDRFYYSYGVGWMGKFACKNHTLGILSKVGLMWPGILYNSPIPPIYVETSLFYTL